MASTSSKTPSLSLPSSSSSIPGSNYDVFLSFRGEDTRHGFTDHLYNAFRLRGIVAFRDSEKLKLGQEIASELIQAIENSQYAIVVFSEKYADSRWCLDELAEIVECNKNKGLKVVPVFYHVDPSDVRNQTGPFEKAFDEYQKNDRINREKIHKWKDAMREMGNLCGEHLLPHQRSEATVIEKIIQSISPKLDHKFPIVSKHLVGMDSRVKDMLDLCPREGLDCVHFVGICGMGGIGKTTLAREIYRRIYSDFEASCFLENVRENAKSEGGLVSLQKTLLSKTFIGTDIIIDNSDEGINVIGTRLRNKKVLIVLDDVNEEGQLEALAGNGGWFGPGSIIIVTSRDRHLLRRHGVKHIYEAKELNEDEALKLFSWKAFKKPHPEQNYVDLSMEFVRYANGLPLALKVLGSSLFGRTPDAWRSARDILETNPNRGIMKILQVSLFGLEETQRELFLDIACFFKGEQIYCVIDTLESLGHYPKSDMFVLMDKSLITIASYGTLTMHDLLQEMGQDIVRGEPPKEPGQRSRLWCYEDVLHVLKNNTGTEFVKGIAPQIPFGINEPLSAEVFSKMKNLRFLKIGHVPLPEGLSYLPNELRVIDWHGYPLKSMPTNFQPIKLVELRMRYSGIKKLWKGIMILNKLKLIDMSGSQKLIEIPDLSGALKLEKLILRRCTGLNKIHASVGDLKELIQLDLEGCKNLSSLPNAICSLMSLKTLNLSDCSRLVKLPENLGNLEGLEKLNVSRTHIRGLFSSSKKLLNFPLFRRNRDPYGDGMLTQTLSSLSSLTELDLSYCKLQTVPDVIGCSLSSLKFLHLMGNKFDSLPKNIIRLSNLRFLSVSDCKDLRLLPELPLKMKYLEAEGCTSLETLPFTPEHVFSSHLTNCVKLIENQGYGDMLSTMLARNIQSPDASGLQDFIIPGSEIPKWFSHQSEGTSMNLQGPSDIMGIAVCAVFVSRHDAFLNTFPHHLLPLLPPPGIRVCCNVRSQSPEIIGLVEICSEQSYKIDLCHLWIRYAPFKRKRDKELIPVDANRLSQIDFELEICPLGLGSEVTRWGARLVYEQDIEDLIKNMAGSSSCSITPYEDNLNLDDSTKDTKIKRSRDDFKGDGAGPSGEVPLMK